MLRACVCVCVCECARWICQTSTYAYKYCVANTHTRSEKNRLFVYQHSKVKNLLTYNVKEWSTLAQHAIKLAFRFFTSFFFCFFLVGQNMHFHLNSKFEITTTTTEIIKHVFLSTFRNSAHFDASDINEFCRSVVIRSLYCVEPRIILNSLISKKPTNFTHFYNIRHFRCHSDTHTHRHTQYVFLCPLHCIGSGEFVKAISMCDINLGANSGERTV